MARTALLDQAMPHRWRLRPGSYAEGQGMPVAVNRWAMAKIPTPARYSAKIRWTTGR